MMKNLLFLSSTLLISTISLAQNVGINASGAAPVPGRGVRMGRRQPRRGGGGATATAVRPRVGRRGRRR